MDLVKYWPLRMARLATAFLSVLTVFVCYLAGYEATGKRITGLLAGGLVVFFPQSTFRGINVSNDALVILTSAAATYLIVRLTRRGFTWRTGILAAVAIALAFLSKTSAIFLPITFSAGILSEAASWRTRFYRLGVLAVSLIIVLPWLAHNQVLYGDPLAMRGALTSFSGQRNIKPIASSYFTTRLPEDVAKSFVGVFGYLDLPSPEWVYQLFGVLAMFATAGFIWGAVRQRLDRRFIYLSSSSICDNQRDMIQKVAVFQFRRDTND